MRVERLNGTFGFVFGSRRSNDKRIADFKTLYATLSTAVKANGVANITATVTLNNPKTLF